MHPEEVKAKKIEETHLFGQIGITERLGRLGKTELEDPRTRRAWVVTARLAPTVTVELYAWVAATAGASASAVVFTRGVDSAIGKKKEQV